MPVRLADFPRVRYGMPGNAACPGCPETMGLRYVKMALGDNVVLVIPAGCSSVIQGYTPKSGINFPILNIVFASASSAAAGMEAAFEAQGKDATVVVWAGDGGTGDIGFQAMSGAAERNDNILYICADNEAYMNTGIQRSSLTPFGAWTTTTWTGKTEYKKNIPMIMIAHDVPYVATATVGYPQDFIDKLRKASKIKGFKYIHLLAPDPVGWKFDPSLTAKLGQLAVQTGLFPLFEYENGKLTVSVFSRLYRRPEKRVPIIEYIKVQGRYANLMKDPEKIKKLEEEIERQWKWIDILEKSSNPSNVASQAIKENK
ncbi:2-oxoacid:ferredoxin oxidoreductase, beta subunit [Caldisphaera lagunensis DSM 15908]|uniref:2-oxoacid oxidoreductase (ferredoxin) n=1 Tax=Caldisphaera lagunensis (strain DSM 15908 / JCM 11604 / ANMR 0165 / IC-154) TaxID=1056495 RepID=L0A8Y7_CALLD|nr:3-methyl-2-oxobutanoate dehydrogenase subunit beta [Caldisphaera lagunensis]AFZ70326.1 2-oxoacid:ferredoxin oxidoreductase, beta subunit [Caldisphaera lagunensis DSM 15908]